MKIKTSELTGAALDWAAAQCELMSEGYRDRGLLVHRIGYGQPMPPYSTDWAQGGPILEREIELFEQLVDDTWLCSKTPQGRRTIQMGGKTLLVAAMRCFVASKLGEEVDVPDELS